MRLLYIFLLITSIFCLGIIIYVIIRKSRPGPGPSYYLRDNFELSDTPGLTDTPIGYYLQQDSDFSTNYILMKSGSPDYKTMCGSVNELVGPKLSLVGNYKYRTESGTPTLGSISCAPSPSGNGTQFTCADGAGITIPCCNSYDSENLFQRQILPAGAAYKYGANDPDVVNNTGNYISCVEPLYTPAPPPPIPGNLQGQMVKFWATDYTQASKNRLVLEKDVCTLINQNEYSCNDLNYGLTGDSYDKVLKDGEKCIWNGIEGPPGVNVKFYKGTGGGWPLEKYMCDYPEASREYSDVYQGDGFYAWGDREVCAAKFTISDPKKYSCSPSPP